MRASSGWLRRHPWPGGASTKFIPVQLLTFVVDRFVEARQLENFQAVLLWQICEFLWILAIAETQFSKTGLILTHGVGSVKIYAVRNCIGATVALRDAERP